MMKALMGDTVKIVRHALIDLKLNGRTALPAPLLEQLRRVQNDAPELVKSLCLRRSLRSLAARLAAAWAEGGERPVMVHHPLCRAQQCRRRRHHHPRRLRRAMCAC